MKAFVGLAVLAAATPAFAQVQPVPDRNDPRIGWLRYGPAETARLNVPVGNDATIILPPGETVTAINPPAPVDWQLDVRSNGQMVVTRPVRPGPDVAITFSTPVRSYRFVLSTTPSNPASLVVNVLGPVRSAPATSPAANVPTTEWELKGNKELKPSAIYDDGMKTYIEWPPAAAIPAVLAVDGLGREEMVNGYMRGSVFVLDRVFDRLLFRIDSARAEARRRPVRP